MTRIVAIVGPTGAGKTELGIALAQHFDAEIINADSRQVYRRLDIGSAKPTAAQRAAVPHHVIDLVDPDEAFDCARFRTSARAAITDITSRGRRVLVVGGTGLYIKTLLHGLFAAPGRDAALRARLEREEESAPGTLHRRLSAVDPPAAVRLHAHDRMRLIRALEVYELTGRPISDWQAEHRFAAGEFESLVVGLSLPRADLYARINARCEAMVNDGLVEEVCALYAAGYAPELPALCSVGYRQIGEYVRGRYDLVSAIDRMGQATRNFAKRQLTWFRGDPAVQWYAPEFEAIRCCVEAFWG